MLLRNCFLCEAVGWKRKQMGRWKRCWVEGEQVGRWKRCSMEEETDGTMEEVFDGRRNRWDGGRGVG